MKHRVVTLFFAALLVCGAFGVWLLGANGLFSRFAEDGLAGIPADRLALGAVFLVVALAGLLHGHCDSEKVTH